MFFFGSKSFRSSLLCYGFFLVSVFSFVQCADDDNLSTGDHQHVHTSASNIVAASYIPEIMNFLKDASGGEMSFRLQARPGTREPDLVIDSVLTQDILQLTNPYDRSSYSFKVSKENTDTELSVINLVVKESGTETYGYFIKYSPDPDWLSTQSGIMDMTSYAGAITVYDIQGHFITRSTFSSGLESYNDLADCLDNTNNNNDSSGGNDGNDNSNNNNDNNNNDSGTGGDNIDILIVCGCPPQHPGGNANPNCNCTLGDLIIINIGNRSVQNAVRAADPCVPDCYEPNGDPCEFGCDTNGDCLPDPNDPQNDGVNIDLLVFLALSNLADDNDTFVYPATNIDPNNALSFNSVQEFENYLNSTTLHSGFPVVLEQDGTHTSRFQVEFGVVLPINLDIYVNQILADLSNGISYSVVDVETSYTGFTLGTSWSQVTYDYTVVGDEAIINLYGNLNYNLFLENIGTVFTDAKQYEMRVNINTGEEVSFIEIEN